MSFWTGTLAEVFYSMPASGQTLASSVTKTLISANTTTNPACQLPAIPWQADTITGRAFKVVARGIWGDTGTAPTYAFSVQLDPTQNSNTSAITLAATSAITPTGTSITNGEWEIDFDITFQSVGVSAGSNVANFFTGGHLNFSNGAVNNNQSTTTQTFLVGTSATQAWTIGQAYWLEVWGTIGTSNAANLLQCTQLLVYGLR